MAKDKKIKKANPKKELRNSITAKLDAALAEYKTEAGEKRFTDALKKSSKLLGRLLAPKKKKKKAQKIKVKVERTENTSQ
jgi:hypothetical protein